ncbi:MAG: ankyrin repeat domain-containing protein [Acidobacteriota bacterium]
MSTRHRHLSPTWLLALTGLLAPVALGAPFLEAQPRTLEAEFEVAFRAAQRSGDVARVRVLLAVGADPDGGWNGNRVLPRAIRRGSLALTEVLLDAGATLGSMDINPALDTDDVAMMELLLGRGFDPNQATWWGSTPLLRAVEVRAMNVARVLLEAGASPQLELTQYFPRQPLHRAIDLDSSELVDLLLDHGASIDAETSHGATALQLAVLYRRDGLARRLIEAGAHVDPFTQRALGDPGALEWLTETNTHFLGSQGLLHLAYHHRRLDLARWLLDQGLDVDLPDRWGQTALHLAVSARDLEMVVFLLSHGARVDLADHSGRTALHVAAGCGYQGGVDHPPTRPWDREIVDLLLASGADLDAAMSGSLYVSNLWQPVHCAVGSGRLELARLLLASGASASSVHYFERREELACLMEAGSS